MALKLSLYKMSYFKKESSLNNYNQYTSHRYIVKNINKFFI